MDNKILVICVSGTVILTYIGFFQLHVGLSQNANNARPNFVDSITHKPMIEADSSASGQHSKGLPSVYVGTPIMSKVPEDPTKDLNQDISIEHGKVAYTFTDRQEMEKENSKCYLSIQKINSILHKEKGASNSTVTYPLHVTNGFALDPRFSPNSNYILLKIGLAFTNYDKFLLYVFDTTSGTVKMVSPYQIAFRDAWWSPDSKHIAYIIGGDSEGSIDRYAPGPLRLMICDWRTGQESLVIESKNGLRFNVAWADSETLLYGNIESDQITSAEEQSNTLTLKNKKFIEPKDSINTYAFSLKDHRTQLLLKNGRRPLASPNSQLLAYFGPEDPKNPIALNQDWWMRPGGAALVIAKKDDNSRKVLDMESGRYPFILWKKKGAHLLSMKQIKESPAAKSIVKEWDLVTGQYKTIGTITSNDFKEIPRSIVYPPIYPIKVSEDDKNLFFVKQEYVSQTGSLLDENHQIAMMNLHDGSIHSIFEDRNSLGLDFTDIDN